VSEGMEKHWPTPTSALDSAEGAVIVTEIGETGFIRTAPGVIAEEITVATTEDGINEMLADDHRHTTKVGCGVKCELLGFYTDTAFFGTKSAHVRILSGRSAGRDVYLPPEWVLKM